MEEKKEEVKQEEVVQSTETQEKPKSKTGLIAIVAVVLVALVAGGYFLFGKKSPEQVFSSTIDSVFKELSNSLDEAKKNDIDFNLSKPFSMSGDITFNISGDEVPEEYKKLSGYKLGFTAGMDLGGEKMSAKLKISGEGKDIIDGQALLDKNMAYLSESSIISGVVKTDLGENIFKEIKDELGDALELSTSDINTLANKTSKYLKESIDSKYLVQEDAKVTLDGKEVDLVANKLDLNQEVARDIAKNLLNKIKADEDYLKIVSKMSQTKVDDIKEKIDSTLKEIEDAKDNDGEVIHIIIYATKNGIVKKAEIKPEKEKGSFVYEVLKDKENFVIEADGQKIEAVRVGKETTITTKIDGEELKLVITKESDKKATGKLTFNGVEANYTAEYENGKVKESITVKGEVEGINLDATINMTIDLKGGVDTLDTSNAKDLEDLTEDDLHLDKFVEKVQGTALYDIIESFASSSYDDDDYDYDYDYDYDDDDFDFDFDF